MALLDVGIAVKRVVAALQRRPELGIHRNDAAFAKWVAGTRVVTRSAHETAIATDMPTELGGSGDQVTPGWLFRASLASCAATSIVIAAADRGITLTALDVEVGSQSDARGLLGMPGSDGTPVHAGLFDVEIRVTLKAPEASTSTLAQLVESCLSHSPIPCTVASATPFKLHVNVLAD